MSASSTSISRGTTNRASALARALGRSLIVAITSIGLVFAIWLGVVYLSGISPYVAKGPVDVIRFLFFDEKSPARLSELGTNLGVTLGHSVIGFAGGLAAAILAAVLFRLSRSVESAFMPIAMLLRSVPLVAMAPVIILAVGIGTDASVAIIGGIVVLFPALVTIAFGLKNASPQMLDTVTVYGGGRLMAIRKIALPGSIPSLFAAIRISIPGAVTGALLAEVLSTGDGIGHAAMVYGTQARFPDLWASVVVVTLVTLVLYQVIQILESVVLARMGMTTRS